MNFFFLEVDWFFELGFEYLVQIRIFKGVANFSWVLWIYWFFKVQPDVQSVNQLLPCVYSKKVRQLFYTYTWKQLVHRLHIRLYLEKPINPPNPGKVCYTLKNANLDWTLKPQLENPVYFKEKNFHHTSELGFEYLSPTGWGGVRMWLQRTACKRGKTSSTSGLLTNLQINKYAKVYSKVFIPGPWQVRRARAALSASLPRRLSGRRGRERPLPIKPRC